MYVYVSVLNTNNELYHHGIKGQKWGVRRYQNPDGSLTPEGYKRYGYNGSPISKNTRERIKQGAKIGAKIGTAAGAISGTLAAGSLVTAGITNPVFLVGVGATYLGSFAASGAARGSIIGAIYGASETSQARKFMKDLDGSVKISDLNESNKK